jgi:hypothetical protein
MGRARDSAEEVGVSVTSFALLTTASQARQRSTGVASGHPTEAAL